MAEDLMGAGLDEDPLARLGRIHGDWETSGRSHPEYRLIEDRGRQPATASGLGQTGQRRPWPSRVHAAVSMLGGYCSSSGVALNFSG